MDKWNDGLYTQWSFIHHEEQGNNVILMKMNARLYDKILFAS